MPGNHLLNETRPDPLPRGAEPAGPVAALVRDPFVWAQVATLVGVAVFYGLPVASHQSREAFTWAWVCLPFMVWPVIAALSGLDRIEATDRRFWQLVGGSLACWLVALVVYGARQQTGWPSQLGVIIDLSYLASYVLLFVAIDYGPQLPRHAAAARLEHRLRVVGFCVFGLGWSFYFVIVPTLMGGDGFWPTASESVMFVLLDMAVLARIVAVWQGFPPDSRWRTVYMMLGVAMLTLTVADVVGLAETTGAALWPAGGLLDVSWGIPGTAFLLAVRVRHGFVGRYEPPPTSKQAHHTEATQLGAFLMLGAISFPLVHSMADTFSWLPSKNQMLATGLWFVMALAAVSMVGLAILAHGALARERARAQREGRDLEAQLLQAQKMEAIGRLAGGVAHDFNNLLTAIAGYADLVIENTPPQDANRGMLEEIRSATDRATTLTRQLLSFSRRQTVKIEPVDLNRLVLDLRSMAQRLIGEDVRLETKLAPTPVTVQANLNQFEQVLLNLIVNARDAMPAGGTLSLATELSEVTDTMVRRHPWLRSGPHGRLTVTDTGTGILPDVLPHIFDPFFTTKDRDKGTGLGLSMVYGTVRQCGGVVWAESEPGKGTQFVILVPSAWPATTTAPAAQPAAGGNETILLAEDDVPVRQLTRAILVRQGYHVLEGTSAPEAARIAESHDGRIDLLLTDVVMPELSGPALADHIQRVRPGTRVLFMSGYTDSPLHTSGPWPSTNDLVPKPFTPPSLLRAVRQALDRPALSAPGPSA